MDMRESTIQTLTPLLNFLRGYDVLEETPGEKFRLKGKDLVHFHDDPDGLWADVNFSKGRIRMSVSSRSEQGELMDMTAKKLDSLDSNSEHRRRSHKNA
jgi:hypothetical protein